MEIDNICAIIGLILLGGFSMFWVGIEAIPVATSVVSGVAGYIAKGVVEKAKNRKEGKQDEPN